MRENLSVPKRKNHNPVVRFVSAALLVITALSFAYFALLCIGLNTVSAFNLFWIGLGFGCLAVYALLRLLGRRGRKAQRRFAKGFLALACVALAFVLFVEVQIVGASFAVPKPGADYLLVLGARVKDTGPSVLLQFRIDKAEQYMNENPQTLAILCGGQGADEPMSEAQAMYDALVDRGISAERLIMEDQSESTAENIRNAMAIMENPDASVVITTTGYHVYRALYEARHEGLKDVSGNPARCAWFTPLNYYVREFFAVVRDWIFMR